MHKALTEKLEQFDKLLDKNIEGPADSAEIRFAALNLRTEIESVKNRESTTPQKLLCDGGPWLGAARRYIQREFPGGDYVEWSSCTDRLTVTIYQLEELAAHAVHADRQEDRSK